jgi:hypothetical protein
VRIFDLIAEIALLETARSFTFAVSEAGRADLPGIFLAPSMPTTEETDDSASELCTTHLAKDAMAISAATDTNNRSAFTIMTEVVSSELVTNSLLHLMRQLSKR